MSELTIFRLDGRVALVTGAGGLLGFEHSAALIESGAHVVLTDLNEQVLQKNIDRLRAQFGADCCTPHAMNVTSEQSILDAATALSAAGRRIDILVNNAAIDPKVTAEPGVKESSRLENFDLASWNLQVSVGLTGAFLCAKVFGTRMAQDGKGGVILNIASDLSVIAPDQRLYRQDGRADNDQPVKPVTYSVIKAGLVGLTNYLSTYWADQGVRANALSPGGVYVGQNDAFVGRLTNLIPMGRMAQPNEYRGIVQFLCSDASAYMNGQNIVMDGGRSAW
ncbi:SDR family oxidoreductase [Devosia sp.]|uniref:SDR family oxidoreductase n=1 Tax=Devosia sp. TaxID=1871048 RepID=UPI00326684E2